MNNIEHLNNAVVLQAVQDYRHARKTLASERATNYARAKAIDDIKSIEKFFLSEDLTRFTEVDGAYLLRKLKEEDITSDGKRIKKSYKRTDK